MITNISEYYVGMLVGSPNMLVAINNSYLIMATNNRFDNFIKETNGKSPKANLNINNIISKDNDSMLKDMIANFAVALKGGGVTVIHKFSQGKLVGESFEMAFYPIMNEHEEIIGAGCVAKNVTERENLIISLKASKNIFSLASRLAHLAPWEFDAKNNVFIFNDEIYALYGTSVKEMGNTMTPEVFAKKIIHPDDAPMVQDFFAKVFKLKELETIFDFESRIIRIDNHQTRIIKVLARIVKDENGKVLELYGTNQDVTEQRETEEKLGKIQQEEETIFDSIRAWIFFKDKENRFIRINKAYADVMGASKQELEGKSLFDLYPKEMANKFWKDDLDVINSGVSKLNIIEESATPSGNIWTQTDKIPYRNKNGEIIGVIGFAVDITEQKKAEETVKDKIEELEKFNKLFTDREIKMIELKDEIARLTKKCG